MALIAGLLTASKIAGSLFSGKKGGTIVSGGAKGAIKKSMTGGASGNAKIGKEPIWSSGTTVGGEYLSSGDRKALFRKSRAKISSSSSFISPSSALVPISEGDMTSEGMGLNTRKTLEERVINNEKKIINNEKKITVIKRIIKIQQQPFAGGTLEEVNRILEDIGNALALDFGNRITQRENEIANLKASAESKRRGGIESGLETVNKISKKVNSAFGAVIAPATGILNKILGFFGNLAAGFVADKALTWLSNNKEAVTGFFQFLQDHGKKILIALGVFIGGVIAVKVVKTIMAVVKFIKGAIFIIRKALQIAGMLLEYGPRALGKMGKVFGIGGKVTKKTTEKVSTKVAQKTGLKSFGMIPIIGNVVDVGMGIHRAFKGDWTGAGLSFGSALPGPAGWAFATADIGRDVIQMQDLKPPESDNSIEVMETIRQSDMSGLGGQSGGGVENSLPMISATDISNGEINYTVEQLGIY